MASCIKASRTESGIVQIAASPQRSESWDKVKEEAAESTKLETLVGYGRWTALYRVQFRDGYYATYAVEES